MATARLGSIALDCASPSALATFWAELLGGEIAFTSETFVAVKTDQSVGQPLILVTIGAASPAATRVIEAAKTILEQ